MFLRGNPRGIDEDLKAYAVISTTSRVRIVAWRRSQETRQRRVIQVTRE